MLLMGKASFFFRPYAEKLDELALDEGIEKS